MQIVSQSAGAIWAPGSRLISSTPLFTNSRKNPGVSLRGMGNEDLTVSTMPLFLLSYLSLSLHSVSPLLLPPLLFSPPIRPLSLVLFMLCNSHLTHSVALDDE